METGLIGVQILMLFGPMDTVMKNMILLRGRMKTVWPAAKVSKHVGILKTVPYSNLNWKWIKKSQYTFKIADSQEIEKN